MKCETCIWGKTVFSSISARGQKKIIVCSGILCTLNTVNEKMEPEMEKKPLIYVCSPLRGNAEKNLMRAARYCRFVSQKGAIPFAPHLYFSHFLDDGIQHERELGLEMGLGLMRRCSAMWVFGDTISEGMQVEINLADRLGISVLYYDTACRPIDEPC